MSFEVKPMGFGRRSAPALGRTSERQRSFFRDQRGGIAVIFAFALVVLACLVGMAVDYGRVISVKAAMDNNADAVILQAAQWAAKELVAGNPDWEQEAKEGALARFNSMAAGSGSFAMERPAVTVTSSGNTVSARLAYSADINTTLLSVVGLTSITFRSSASAKTTALPYTDFHIVIDNSESMGIGATAADSALIGTINPAPYGSPGCTFACHINDRLSATNTDTEASAHMLGVVLRIDVAKAAVVAELNRLNGIPANTGQIRVAIYTLSNSLATVYPLSTDISGAIAAVNAIDLTNEADQGGTNTTYALTQLGGSLPVAGNGIRAASPKGIVMLVSDGLQNSLIGLRPPTVQQVWSLNEDPNFIDMSPQFTDYPGEYVQAFDASVCGQVKRKGYQFATMDVAYVIPTGTTDPKFVFIQNTLLSNISETMSACATSPNLATSASSPAEINAAVTQMFNEAFYSRLLLTQ